MTEPRGVYQEHRPNISVKRNPGACGKKCLIAHEIAQGVQTRGLNENHVSAENGHYQQSGEVSQKQTKKSQKQCALLRRCPHFTQLRIPFNSAPTGNGCTVCQYRATALPEQGQEQLPFATVHVHAVLKALQLHKVVAAKGKIDRHHGSRESARMLAKPRPKLACMHRNSGKLVGLHHLNRAPNRRGFEVQERLRQIAQPWGKILWRNGRSVHPYGISALRSLDAKGHSQLAGAPKPIAVRYRYYFKPLVLKS